jgi:hypothetical protein
MPHTRREFVTTSVAAGGALFAASAGTLEAIAPRRRAPLRVLILGGTGFNGPHMVRAALAVTVRDTLEWFKSTPAERQETLQLNLERDAEIVDAWRASRDG